MRRLKFYIQSFLIDRRIWLGIFGVVLVAMMISYNDFMSYHIQGQRQQLHTITSWHLIRLWRWQHI